MCVVQPNYCYCIKSSERTTGFIVIIIIIIIITFIRHSVIQLNT